MKTRRIFAILMICVIIMSLGSISFAATFTDVPGNHPYKAAIDFCQGQGDRYLVPL